MAIMVPPEVGNLFMVLTGEKWPQINEDELMRLGEAWKNAATRLQNELRPDIAAVVKKIREEFRGRAANRFADRMAPLLDSPSPFDAISESFEGSADFLRKMALQTEYVKLVTILSLIELLAQIAWAIAMSGPTFGASMTWLAARYAIVRFMLNRLWGRLIMRVIEAQVFGILTQVAIDAGAQLIQIAKGSKDFSEWDKKATVQAIEVGALGGAMALPLSALGGALGNLFSKTLTSTLGNEVDKQILKAAAESAANKYAKELPNAKSLADLATKISDHMNTHVAKDLGAHTNKNFDGMSLNGMYSHKVGRGLGDVLQQSLHEWLTEATYNASQGEGFQASGFAATAGAVSGMSSHMGNFIGDGMHGNLAPGDGENPFLARGGPGKDNESEVDGTGKDGTTGSGDSRGDSERATSYGGSGGQQSIDESITAPGTSSPPSGETGDGPSNSGDGGSAVTVDSDGQTSAPGGSNLVGGQSNSQIPSNGLPSDSSSGGNRDQSVSGDGKPAGSSPGSHDQGPQNRGSTSDQSVSGDGKSAGSSPGSHDQGPQNRGSASDQSAPSTGPAGPATPTSPVPSPESTAPTPVSSSPDSQNPPGGAVSDGQSGSQQSTTDETAANVQDTPNSGGVPSANLQEGHDTAPVDRSPNVTHSGDSAPQQPSTDVNQATGSPNENHTDSSSPTSDSPAMSPAPGPANTAPQPSSETNIQPGVNGYASPAGNTPTPATGSNPASQSTATNSPVGTPKSPDTTSTHGSMSTSGKGAQRLGDVSVTASTEAPSTPAKTDPGADTANVEVQVDSDGRPVDQQGTPNPAESTTDTSDADGTFSIDDIITPAEAPPDTDQSGETRPWRGDGGTVFPGNSDVDAVHRQLATQNRFGDGNFTAFVSAAVPSRGSTRPGPHTSRPVRLGDGKRNAEQFADVLKSPDSGWNGKDPIVLVSSNADHHHGTFANDLSNGLGVQVTPVRMSGNGNIAIGGPDGKAYAKKETIDAAANRLESEGSKSRITLEAGPKELTPGSGLREVVPVYRPGKVPTDMDDNVEPVKGESPDVREQKALAYRKYLDSSDRLGEIMKLQNDVLATYDEAASSWNLPGTKPKPPGQVTLDMHRNALGQLVNGMGGDWVLAHPDSQVVHQRTPNPPPSKRIFLDLFRTVLQDYGEVLESESNRLGNQGDLPITLPNDCKGAASRISGQEATEVGTARENPDIGQNYYKKFAEEGGWQNHFATVILKDGDTDLSFETAADFTAKQPESKSFGFFEMYQRNSPLDFDGIIDAKNDEYAAKKGALDSEPDTEATQTPAAAPPETGSRSEVNSSVPPTGDGRRFTSPTEWGGRRDSAPKAVVNEFSFEPVKEDVGNAKGKGPLFEGGRLTGIKGFLPGRNTYINTEIRRFQIPDGGWVREYTIKADLVSKNDQLSPEQRGEVADRLRRAVDTHINEKYRLPGGDQLHVSVDFDTPKWDDRSKAWDVDSSQRPPVEVHDSQGGANQLRWGTGDDALVLLHELMHYLGLKDAYESPDTVLGREETKAKNEAEQQGRMFTEDDQRELGLMGPKFRENPVLTDKNLARLKEISQSGSVLHDHPLGAPETNQPDSAPRTDRARSPDPLGNPAQKPAQAPNESKLERAPWAGERNVATWSVDQGGQGKLELSHYVHGAQHRFDFGNGVEERYDVDRDWTNNRDPAKRDSIAMGAQNIRNTQGIGIPDVLWYRLNTNQVSADHSLLDGIIDSVADLGKEASWQPNRMAESIDLAGRYDRDDPDQRRLAAHLAALRATIATREAVMKQLNVSEIEVRTGKGSEKITIDWDRVRQTMRLAVLDQLSHHPEPGSISGRRPGRVPPSHSEVGPRMTREFLPDIVRSDAGLNRLDTLGLIDKEGRSGRYFQHSSGPNRVLDGRADQLSHAWNHLRFLGWMEWRSLHELLNNGDAGDVLETRTEYVDRRRADSPDDANPSDDVITPAEAPSEGSSKTPPTANEVSRDTGNPRDGGISREPSGDQRTLPTIPEPESQDPSEPDLPVDAPVDVQPRPRARVLVVSDISGMGGGGVPVFNMELVKGLSVNHDVTMLTVDPDPGYDNDKKTREHGSAQVVNIATPKGTEPRDFFGQLVTQPAEKHGMPTNPDSFDVIIGHSRFSGPGAQEVRQAWYPNAKMVHFLHTSPLRLDRIKGEHGKGARKSKAERMAMRDADLVAGVGPLLTEEAERLSQQIRNVPALHQFVPGTEIGPINPRSERDSGSIKLLLPGRATDEIKGVESAIRAIGILRDLGMNVELTIRGAPDPEKDPAPHRFWQELAGDLGRGGVTLKPFSTDAEELAGDRAEADALIMPSLHEGFGLVATEAAGRGVPVLVNSESGAAQFLEQFEELGVPNPMVVATPFRIDPTTSREVTGGAEERARAWAQAIGRLSETLSTGRENAEDLHGLLEQYTWQHAADALVEAALETPGPEGDSRHGGITRQGPEGTLIRESDQRPDWEPQGFWDGSTPRPPQYDPETPEQRAERIERLHNTGILLDAPVRPPRSDETDSRADIPQQSGNTPQLDRRTLGGDDDSSVPNPEASTQDSTVVRVQDGHPVTIDSVPTNGNRRVVLVSASDPASRPVRFETTGSRLAADLNKEVVALADNGRGRTQWRSFPADGSRSRIVSPEAVTSVLAAEQRPA